jgi:hypothetical protein
MARVKVTWVLDDSVVRATRVHAARKDRRDSEVVEEALRAYLGLDLWEKLRADAAGRPEISLEEIVAIQHETRASRRAGRSRR